MKTFYLSFLACLFSFSLMAHAEIKWISDLKWRGNQGYWAIVCADVSPEGTVEVEFERCRKKFGAKYKWLTVLKWNGSQGYLAKVCAEVTPDEKVPPGGILLSPMIQEVNSNICLNKTSALPAFSQDYASLNCGGLTQSQCRERFAEQRGANATHNVQEAFLQQNSSLQAPAVESRATN